MHNLWIMFLEMLHTTENNVGGSPSDVGQHSSQATPNSQPFLIFPAKHVVSREIPCQEFYLPPRMRSRASFWVWRSSSSSVVIGVTLFIVDGSKRERTTSDVAVAVWLGRKKVSRFDTCTKTVAWVGESYLCDFGGPAWLAVYQTCLRCHWLLLYCLWCS